MSCIRNSSTFSSRMWSLWGDKSLFNYKLEDLNKDVVRRGLLKETGLEVWKCCDGEKSIDHTLIILLWRLCLTDTIMVYSVMGDCSRKCATFSHCKRSWRLFSLSAQSYLEPTSLVVVIVFVVAVIVFVLYSLCVVCPLLFCVLCFVWVWCVILCDVCYLCVVS
jgi:hypothetical protein